MNKVTLFKIEDFNNSIKNYPKEGIQEYLNKLNEILNEEDYWDWKPVLLELINGNEIIPLWHSINSTGNSKEYTFEFGIPKLLLDKKDKEVITKEFENIFNTGDEDDSKAVIVIRNFLSFFESSVTIRKSFTF